RLFELEQSEVAALSRTPSHTLFDGTEEPRPNSPLDFKAAFKGALRTAGLVVVFSMATAIAAKAQRPNATPARTQTTTTTTSTPAATATSTTTRPANAPAANGNTAAQTAQPARTGGQSAAQLPSQASQSNALVQKLAAAGVAGAARGAADVPKMDLKIGNG